MHDNTRGSLMMVLAMAAFAVEDMLVKFATEELPVGLVLMLFGAGGMVAFCLLARRQGLAIWHPALLTRAVALKSAGEVVGRLSYMLALALSPLSSASAILQAAPLVVVAGAAMVFGERVGWRRWSAVMVGFAGVLLILRPGLSGFEAASLWAVIGTLGFAVRDLGARAAPRVLANLQLGIWGFALLVPTGALMLAVEGGAVMPSARAWGLLAGAVGIGVLAYYALMAAMRLGEVSVVTPFRYTRLIFAMGLGIAVFAERPDLATILGSLVVIASGLYTLLRARGEARAAAALAAAAP